MGSPEGNPIPTCRKPCGHFLLLTARPPLGCYPLCSWPYRYNGSSYRSHKILVFSILIRCVAFWLPSHNNSLLEDRRRVWWKTTAGGHRTCLQMLWSRKRNIKHKTRKRLCPEGKPLFYPCIYRRRGWTRIETRTSLDVLRREVGGWFPRPDSNLTESRHRMWCLLSVCCSSMFLLTQQRPLSAGRAPQWGGVLSPTRRQNVFIWNCSVIGG